MFRLNFNLISAISVIFAAIHFSNGQANKFGQWEVIGHSGVSSMHGILVHTNKVIFIERAETQSESVANAKEYYSTEYDLATNTFRNLDLVTNTFCSAGAYLPDGSIISVGGAESVRGMAAGFNGIRFYAPCSDTSCDWVENSTKMATGRWYPSVEALQDGTLFIVGGSTQGASVNTAQINVPNYEFYPPRGTAPVAFQWLIDTLPYNLYPHVKLMSNGDLFILAGNTPGILSTTTWQVSPLPNIPGSPRAYPLTAGSVLLPFTIANKNKTEILVCGGSATLATTSQADATCGRIAPLDPSPAWAMETMSFARLMPDLTLLPDGTVGIFNGCKVGVAGFGKGDLPTLVPTGYNPDAPSGQRFTNWYSSVIPRLYHSISMTIPDGRVLISGSNPNENPSLQGNYPTEFRVEAFSPPYLFAGPQPKIVNAPSSVGRGKSFSIQIETYSAKPSLRVAVLNSGFVTHSTHMHQRWVELQTGSLNGNSLSLTAPAGALVPPTYYMLFLLDNGIPSVATWIQITP